MSEKTTEQKMSRHQAGAFDIRVFIAALIGLYGVILLLTGLLGTSDADLAKAGGVNVNVWAGLGMIVFASLFVAWARVRPVVVREPDHVAETEAAHSEERAPR